MHHIRAVLSDPILWDEGVPAAEICQRLSAQYGNSALPQGSVFEYIVKLKNCITSVTEAE